MILNIKQIVRDKRQIRHAIILNIKLIVRDDNERPSVSVSPTKIADI